MTNVIDECSLLDKCFGNCTNLPGNYICQCPQGTHGNPYVADGCIRPHDQNLGNCSCYGFLLVINKTIMLYYRASLLWCGKPGTILGKVRNLQRQEALFGNKKNQSFWRKVTILKQIHDIANKA